jgi:uncharacterized protein (TIGR03437 family)
MEVEVQDANGILRKAALFFVSAGQVNFLVPEGTSAGPARFTVVGEDGARSATTVTEVRAVAPALFSANATGAGAAAALAVRVENDGRQVNVPVFHCSGPGFCFTQPIGVSDSRPVYLSFFGTGIRNRGSLAGVTVSVGGQRVPVVYAGQQGQYAGLDQVNVRLPASLRGGEQDVVLTVDGSTANTVRIRIQ